MLRSDVFGQRPARNAPLSEEPNGGDLLAEGLVVKDLTERIELPKAWRRLPGVLGRDDVGRLLDAPDPTDRLLGRDKALLEFASSVRVSELTALKVRDLGLIESAETSSLERLRIYGPPHLPRPGDRDKWGGVRLLAGPIRLPLSSLRSALGSGYARSP